MIHLEINETLWRMTVGEEGRLNDLRSQENFIESFFTLKRWRETTGPLKSRGALVDFHSRHKLLILSHSTELYREMGRLVAGTELPPAELYDNYLALLMKALKLQATVKKNVNVLQHVLGYFKHQLSADEKQEALETIENYRRGVTPLIVPVTLINHFVHKYDQPYLKQQVYLNPHPLELWLRNHG